MLDRLGRTLRVGDDALYFYVSGSSLRSKKVLVCGFTAKMVRITDPGGRYPSNVSPERLIWHPEEEIAALARRDGRIPN